MRRVGWGWREWLKIGDMPVYQVIQTYFSLLSKSSSSSGCPSESLAESSSFSDKGLSFRPLHMWLQWCCKMKDSIPSGPWSPIPESLKEPRWEIMSQKLQINVRCRRVRHYVKENDRITSLDVHWGPYVEICRWTSYKTKTGSKFIPWISANTSSRLLTWYEKWVKEEIVVPTLSWRFGWLRVPLNFKTVLVRRGSTSQTADEPSSNEPSPDASEGVPTSQARNPSESMISKESTRYSYLCDEEQLTCGNIHFHLLGHCFEFFKKPSGCLEANKLALEEFCIFVSSNNVIRTYFKKFLGDKELGIHCKLEYKLNIKHGVVIERYDRPDEHVS